MDRPDFIILVAFLISILYVVSRAINDLDNQTKYEFDKKGLTAQLEERMFGETPLSKLLDITFRFPPYMRYKFSDDPKGPNTQPKELSMIINNKASDVALYVDWDQSSIVTDYNDSSRRAIRLEGGQVYASMLPLPPQAPTAIAPNTSYTTSITAEGILKPDEEKPNVFKPSVAVLDLNALKTLGTRKKPPPPPKAKKFNREFRLRETPLKLYARIWVRLVHLETHDKGDYLLYCQISVTNMHWFDQIPWSNK
jgi:hypothetical protein